MELAALGENPDIQQEDFIYRETKARFFRHKEQSGDKIEAIAHRMGKPPGMLVQYLSGGLDPYGKMVIQGAVLDYLDRQEKSKPSLEDLILSTTVVKDVLESIRWCDEFGKMGSITGDAGCGKTTAIRKYLKKHGETTVVMTCGITVKCVRAVLEGVSDNLGDRRLYSKSNSFYLKRIIECLQERPRVLIFDEAPFLSWDAWEALRQIWDNTKTGMVFIGQQRLLSEMRGRRSAYLFDQILSRLAIRRQVGGSISKGDVELISGAVFSEGLDRKSLDFLYEKTTGDGKFRTLNNILTLARQMSGVSKKPINLTILREASRFLMV
ncbi:MAG: AAA family ATPase [Desulfovibrionales bacterium]|nr:AAA family ATPase [Desulfovibrionales bacterium]